MKTITWYEAEKPEEKKGAKKTAKAGPVYTADVKLAALREDGRPIVHHVEIRGDDDGTD